MVGASIAGVLGYLTGGVSGAATGVCSVLIAAVTGGLGGALLGNFFGQGAAVVGGNVIGGCISGAVTAYYNAPPGEKVKYAVVAGFVGSLVGACGGLVALQSELNSPETLAGFMSAVNESGVGLLSGGLSALIDGLIWVLSKI